MGASGQTTVTCIRSERKARGWTVLKMAQKLRDAADDPREVPHLDSLKRNIWRWERGNSLSEQYRILYCRALNRSEQELFGISQPGSATGAFRPDIPAVAGLPLDGAGDGAYVVLVLVLPRGPQRIVIDVSGADANGALGGETEPARRLTIVKDTDARIQ